jgi:hypothetical protein
LRRILHLIHEFNVLVRLVSSLSAAELKDFRFVLFAFFVILPECMTGFEDAFDAILRRRKSGGQVLRDLMVVETNVSIVAESSLLKAVLPDSSESGFATGLF